ncbi:DUF2895 family protein [Vibrio mediterranei]
MELAFLPKKMVQRLQEHTSHVISLRIMIGILTMALMMSLYLASKIPDRLTIYIPPDLSNGAVIQANDVPKASILTNTTYLWVELNTWLRNGKEDAFNNLEAYRYYYSDHFIKQMERQYQTLGAKGELDRQRRVTLVPGTLSDFERRVIVQNKGLAWVVLLDVVIEDFFLGEKVQHVRVRYSLLVERIETNYDQNPLGLMIVGLAEQPKVIQEYQ